MISRSIKTKILRGGQGKLWRVTDFPEYTPRTVAKTLSRLSEKGFLEKIKIGTYYYGKQTIIGKTAPTPEDISKKIMDKKFQGGINAFYNLGLTTQVPSRLNIVSNSQTKLKNVKITRRNINHLKSATIKEFWILEALRNLNKIPDCSPEQALHKIKSYIKRNHISMKRLCRFAMEEPPRIRSLLGALGQEMKLDRKTLKKLKTSLNPITIYRLNTGNALKFGKDWNIE